jgi:lysophospholipase L1-like esterase
VNDAPYPRADPAGAEYLPADVWAAARLPVGVRLELAGNAKTIRVWYETTRAALGYRGESAGCAFVAYRAGQRVAMTEAVMGEGIAELVMSGRPDLPVTIYLPEGMAPLVTGVAGVEDTMVPAPLQPRWLAYGDAVTQGWLASAPPMAWPAVAGRKLGLDVCNLGYAGTARGEMTSALMLAETPAEVVSIAFGLNNWSRVPHTAALMAEEVRCFLSVVREGHPETPIVVVSPTARPDAESEPNRLGATLAELRTAMEDTVRTCMADGDEKLFLVEGLAVLDPDDLEDGVYPGDEGHRRLAAAVSKILVPHLADLQAAAEKRWAGEGVSPIPLPIPTPVVHLLPPADAPSDVEALLPELGSAPARDISGVAFPDFSTPELATTEVASASEFAASEFAMTEWAAAEFAATGFTTSEFAVEQFGTGQFGKPEFGTTELAATPFSTAESVDAVFAAQEIARAFEMVDTAAEPPSATDIGPGGDVESATHGTTPNGVSPIGAVDGPEPAEAGHDRSEHEVQRPGRRDTAPVDIAVADMVVAALTLATNGADDVIYGREHFTEDDLQWAEASDPTSY